MGTALLKMSESSLQAFTKKKKATVLKVYSEQINVVGRETALMLL